MSNQLASRSPVCLNMCIYPSGFFSNLFPTMSTAIEAPPPRVPTQFNLLDAQANGSLAADPSPLPCQPLHANSRVTIIQNNFIGEGTTINIFSSNCHGSTVTRLYRDVAGTASAEPTSSWQPLPSMLARQSEPVDYRDSRESIVMNGNTFSAYVMINIGSQHCTGAVTQTVGPTSNTPSQV